MVYKLVITEQAEKHVDQLIGYLLFELLNDRAAKRFADVLSNLYDRIEENPYQFPYSEDLNLKRKGYRKAVLIGMNYLVIYKIEFNLVYILGVFHELENYQPKLKEHQNYE